MAERDGKCVLVTGAAGFIGSHLVERLSAMGHRVVGVDNFDPFYPRATKERMLAEVWRSVPGFELIEADITDAGAMRRVFERGRIDGVIHLAAKAGVRPSIADPVGYAHTNVTGTAVVMQEAHRAGCARIVIASSSSVYGNNAKTPFAETDDVSGPVSPYAATKRACELIGHAHWSLTKMPTAMLRFFTVFGPRQRPDLAIAQFMEKIARGEEIVAFGDGSMSRDFTYIDDIVSGVVAAYERIDRFGFRVWNLGHNHPVRLSEMIETIGRVAGKPPRVRWTERQPGDVDTTWADLTRSRAELGYEPRVGFEDGVGRQWKGRG